MGCVVYLYLTGFWQAGGGANGRRVTGWGRVGAQQVDVHPPAPCSETSAIRTQTPGNYPKENTLNTLRLYFSYYLQIPLFT